MKPKLLLRIAAVIMLLHDVGHTFGHLTWKHTPDAAKQEVIKQMTDNKFPFMGAVHSMADYYDGYGFAGTLALLFFAAVLWIVSSVDTQTTSMSRKIIFTVSVLLLLWGIDEVIYFFPFAAAFSIAASVLGFYSLALVRKKQ